VRTSAGISAGKWMSSAGFPMDESRTSRNQWDPLVSAGFGVWLLEMSMQKQGKKQTQAYGFT